MVLYPECQKIGQEEVDRVVGRDRLPTFEDRDSLRIPYIDCVIQEVLRYMASSPYPSIISSLRRNSGH